MTALEIASTVMAAVAILLSIVSMLFTRAARRRADAAEIEVTRLLGLAALGDAAARRRAQPITFEPGAVSLESLCQQPGCRRPAPCAGCSRARRVARTPSAAGQVTDRGSAT